MFIKKEERRRGMLYASIQERYRQGDKVQPRYLLYLGRDPWFVTETQANERGLNTERLRELILWERFLFSLADDGQIVNALNGGRIPVQLRMAFSDRGHPLAGRSRVEIKAADREWLIKGQGQEFVILREGEKLNIYSPIYLPVLETNTMASARNCRGFWDQVEALHGHTLCLFCVAIVCVAYPDQYRIEQESDRDVINGWGTICADCTIDRLMNFQGPIPKGDSFLRRMYSVALDVIHHGGCINPKPDVVDWERLLYVFQRLSCGMGNGILDLRERGVWEALTRMESDDRVNLFLRENGVPNREVNLAMRVVQQWERDHGIPKGEAGKPQHIRQ